MTIQIIQINNQKKFVSIFGKNKITLPEIYSFRKFDFAFFIFLVEDEEISGYK